MSTSSTGRPSSSSRTAPPTRNASGPAARAKASSAIDDRPRRTVVRAPDPARDLVVDRAEDVGVLLGEDAVAEDRDKRSLVLAAQLDREGIHRDRANHGSTPAGHQHLRAGQPAAEAVRV